MVHWPNGIEDRGALRHQFTHVIDVAPTVLEAAGLPEPTMVHGVAQHPIEGTSMAYSFNNASAPETHQTQYFEMVGNRGIYHQGWTAVTKHRTPWETGSAPLPAFDDDVWELYDTTNDWTQAHDLAKENPDKLHELQRLWLLEAATHNALPLDDRWMERTVAELAGRPELIHGDTQLLFSAMGRLNENSILNLKNRSHAVTAEIVVGDVPAHGVIVAEGGLPGGWSLYANEGTLKYCYNFYNIERTYVAGTTPLQAGTHQVRMEFAYDGGGQGKGGQVTLYLDGAAIGSGRIERTEPNIFSADETCDVGREYGSPVTDDYGKAGSIFTGEVNWVELDVRDAANDPAHEVDHAERMRVALAIRVAPQRNQSCAFYGRCGWPHANLANQVPARDDVRHHGISLPDDQDAGVTLSPGAAPTTSSGGGATCR